MFEPPRKHFELISRKEAAQRGLFRYYTGKPCKAGHVAERYVSNRNCVKCDAKKSWPRERQRGQRDPSYRMYRSVLTRSRQVLLGRASASDSLGCSHADLRGHIERQFAEGMSWQNYGWWEVDHTDPLSAGHTIEGLVRRCHWSNLQPLWKRDNQQKGGA